MGSPRHLYAVGLTLGVDPHLVFNKDRPYTGCKICGAIFQSDYDRGKQIEGLQPFENDLYAMSLRKLWSQKHAKTHSDREHILFAVSGRWCTPEAAGILASYGVIALSDMVLSEEHADALANAKSIPIKEVEGVLRSDL